MSLTVPISKHPTTNKKREVEYQIFILSNDIHDYEIRVSCTIWELDVNNNHSGTPQLKVITTIGEYVDASGKKKNKNDTGAISKKEYYQNKDVDKSNNAESLQEQFLGMIEDEIYELDNAGYFG